MYFTWNIGHSLLDWRNRAVQIEPLHKHIKIALLWNFVFAWYSAPLKKEWHFSRGGGIYYAKHFALCFGIFKKSKGNITGIVWIDIPQKLIFLLLIFLGVTYKSQSVLVGIGWCTVFYLIYALVTYTKSKGLIEFLINYLNF